MVLTKYNLCCLGDGYYKAGTLDLCDSLVDSNRSKILASTIDSKVAIEFCHLPSKPKSDAELLTVPMQFVASQVYVPKQQVPSCPEMILWMSPGFSSTPSLYHLRIGCGTPITLHSKFTAPSSDSMARKLSRNFGFLKCLGMISLRKQEVTL